MSGRPAAPLIVLLDAAGCSLRVIWIVVKGTISEGTGGSEGH